MEKVYYISQGESPKDHLINIENACIAGCRLIQLRLKDAETGIMYETALAAKGICIKFGAKLIINDNVQVAMDIKADGIHVGEDDMPAREVRLLMPNTILGGTANTIEDCLRLISEKVDYIGLGPFRFTPTKHKLRPILGLVGYETVLGELRKVGHSIPVYAIGGVRTMDAKELYETGVHGLAISSELTGKPLEELSRVFNTLEPKSEKQ